MEFWNQDRPAGFNDFCWYAITSWGLSIFRLFIALLRSVREGVSSRESSIERSGKEVRSSSATELGRLSDTLKLVGKIKSLSPPGFEP